MAIRAGDIAGLKDQSGPIPEGRHTAQVVDARGTTKNGREVWELKFRIVTGDAEGRELREWIYWSANAAIRGQLLLDALGVDFRAMAEDEGVPAEACRRQGVRHRPGACGPRSGRPRQSGREEEDDVRRDFVPRVPQGERRGAGGGDREQRGSGAGNLVMAQFPVILPPVPIYWWCVECGRRIKYNGFDLPVCRCKSGRKQHG